MKNSSTKFGELAPRDAESVSPWSEVHVDLVGPWNVKVKGAKIKLQALTCIDPCLNLLEMDIVDDTLRNTQLLTTRM